METQTETRSALQPHYSSGIGYYFVYELNDHNEQPCRTSQE